jgi:hypothetical protein
MNVSSLFEKYPNIVELCQLHDNCLVEVLDVGLPQAFFVNARERIYPSTHGEAIGTALQCWKGQIPIPQLCPKFINLN